MGDLNIRELLKIQPHELGYECITHPLNTYEVGILYVQGQQVVARAELRVDATRSRLAKEMRQDPKKFGLKKGTDAEIKENVEGHDDLVAARRGLADAYFQMMSAKIAYEQMKDKSVQLGRVKKMMEDGMFGEIRIMKPKPE
jgi:hypothetical protein